MTRRSAVWMLCAAAGVFAQTKNLKVVEMNGHLSPVAIRVTFLDNRVRNVMLEGIGSVNRDAYLTHQFIVLSDGGAAERRLWFDTIASIHGTSTLRTLGSDFTITLKDGRQINASFSAFHDVGPGCSGEPTSEGFTCFVLFVRNEDDSPEKIDLRKVRAVEFLGQPRRDKGGNAMFEAWRFSPFTGERLP